MSLNFPMTTISPINSSANRILNATSGETIDDNDSFLLITLGIMAVVIAVLLAIIIYLCCCRHHYESRPNWKLVNRRPAVDGGTNVADSLQSSQTSQSIESNIPSTAAPSTETPPAMAIPSGSAQPMVSTGFDVASDIKSKTTASEVKDQTQKDRTKAQPMVNAEAPVTSNAPITAVSPTPIMVQEKPKNSPQNKVGSDNN